MGNRLQNEAKTPDMPREMSLEEMDKLTRPNAADEAFKAAAAQAAPALAVSEAPISEPVVDAEKLSVAVDQLLEIGQQMAPKGALEEVMGLRMEFDAKFNNLFAQIAELKTKSSGPKVEGDVVMAQIRGIVHCAECGVQLQGGANTAMANTPYLHPMGSAAPKPCSMVGVRFDMPWVYLKRLPAVPYKKALPA